MDPIITARHLRLTDGLRTHILEKVSKLPRYYDGVEHIEVILDGDTPGQVRVEILAKGKGGKVFVASQDGHDLIGCIDNTVHKLERQLTRKKGIQRDHRTSNCEDLA